MRLCTADDCSQLHTMESSGDMGTGDMDWGLGTWGLGAWGLGAWGLGTGDWGLGTGDMGTGDMAPRAIIRLFFPLVTEEEPMRCTRLVIALALVASVPAIRL